VDGPTWTQNRKEADFYSLTAEVTYPGRIWSNTENHEVTIAGFKIYLYKPIMDEDVIFKAFQSDKESLPYDRKKAKDGDSIEKDKQKKEFEKGYDRTVSKSITKRKNELPVRIFDIEQCFGVYRKEEKTGFYLLLTFYTNYKADAALSNTYAPRDINNIIKVTIHAKDGSESHFETLWKRIASYIRFKNTVYQKFVAPLDSNFGIRTKAFETSLNIYKPLFVKLLKSFTIDSMTAYDFLSKIRMDVKSIFLDSSSNDRPYLNSKGKITEESNFFAKYGIAEMNYLIYNIYKKIHQMPSSISVAFMQLLLLEPFHVRLIFEEMLWTQDTSPLLVLEWMMKGDAKLRKVCKKFTDNREEHRAKLKKLFLDPVNARLVQMKLVEPKTLEQILEPHLRIFELTGQQTSWAGQFTTLITSTNHAFHELSMLVKNKFNVVPPKKDTEPILPISTEPVKPKIDLVPETPILVPETPILAEPKQDKLQDADIPRFINTYFFINMNVDATHTPCLAANLQVLEFLLSRSSDFQTEFEWVRENAKSKKNKYGASNPSHYFQPMYSDGDPIIDLYKVPLKDQVEDQISIEYISMLGLSALFCRPNEIFIERSGECKPSEIAVPRPKPIDPRTVTEPVIEPRTGTEPVIEPRTGTEPVIDPRTVTEPVIQPRTELITPPLQIKNDDTQDLLT